MDMTSFYGGLNQWRVRYLHLAEGERVSMSKAALSGGDFVTAARFNIILFMSVVILGVFFEGGRYKNSYKSYPTLSLIYDMF